MMMVMMMMMSDDDEGSGVSDDDDDEGSGGWCEWVWLWVFLRGGCGEKTRNPLWMWGKKSFSSQTMVLVQKEGAR